MLLGQFVHNTFWNASWCVMSEMIHTSYFEDHGTFGPNVFLKNYPAGEVSVVMFRLRMESEYGKCIIPVRHTMHPPMNFIRLNPFKYNICFEIHTTPWSSTVYLCLLSCGELWDFYCWLLGELLKHNDLLKSGILSFI